MLSSSSIFKDFWGVSTNWDHEIPLTMAPLEREKLTGLPQEPKKKEEAPPVFHRMDSSS